MYGGCFKAGSLWDDFILGHSSDLFERALQPESLRENLLLINKAIYGAHRQQLVLDFFAGSSDQLSSVSQYGCDVQGIEIKFACECRRQRHLDVAILLFLYRCAVGLLVYRMPIGFDLDLCLDWFILSVRIVLLSVGDDASNCFCSSHSRLPTL